ncbi:MAG TPA: hypothetical protein VFU31_19310 [Candidatus Binatia bacterium]|nr:hypothetical protein [Candidatus Binatia bacterium]
MLFTGQMITALLNAKPDVWSAEPIDPDKPFKWQTRRKMKEQPAVVSDSDASWRDAKHDLWVNSKQMADHFSPHEVGQIIYARETFILKDPYTPTYPVFRATADVDRYSGHKWKPGIHMPRAIARLWFIVKRVRVERVNAISEADALAEGIRWPDRDGRPYRPPIDLTGMSKLRIAGERFGELFDSINGTGAFDRGDWCWVYDLARISKPKGIE